MEPDNIKEKINTEEVDEIFKQKQIHEKNQQAFNAQMLKQKQEQDTYYKGKKVYCGLRDEDGLEMHMYLPFKNVRLGEIINLKDKKTGKQRLWTIFGIFNKVF